MNIHQVSKIILSPEVIDCIVFWSKNPRPMLSRLDELKEYMYYFQFTINPYDTSLEISVPKKDGIISTFKELSKAIGPKRVIWRYDPILLTDQMDIKYHVHYFEEIAKRLEGFTNTCVVSFVDLYRKTKNNLKETHVRELSQEEMLDLSAQLNIIAKQYEITIQTCAEEIALESVGIKHGRCVDNALIEDLLGVKLVVSKDPNQRKECGCVQSIDIGEYNTCAHGCKYCYANFRDSMVMRNRDEHDPNSPLLIGHIGDADKLIDRKLFSFIKIPDAFQTGDIVRLRNPNQFRKENDFHDYRINLYKIISFDDSSVRLAGVRTCVPKSELLPVAVDGKEDRWIYYDPVIMASIVFPGDEVPAHSTDYSYYLDAFEHSFDGNKSFKELISKAHLVYVHEIQHFLRKKYNNDYLKINDSKL